MAQELAALRTRFVEKASKELINQLLDDLLEDGVLNDSQKNSIIKENSRADDRARSLIDIVKKKGEEASRNLIDHLQSRDPSLSSDLGLSSGRPAPPAAEQQMKQDCSATLIHTTEAFWREKQNDRNIYPAAKNSMSNRVALLITNIKFTDEKFNRNGAEKDEENTEKLLTALGYEVVKHTNLTGKEIDDAVIEFSKHRKLNKTDSVLLVIMSHGKLGAVLGVDCKKDGGEQQDEFPINNIYKHLGPQKCPALLNKPKIIIIQACRGEEGGSVLVGDAADPNVSCDHVGEDNIEDDHLRFVNKEKDFISLLSCTPDTVSYRHQDHGSFLIQYVAEVLYSSAHSDDIEELFRKVMQRFEDFSSQTRRQMPSKDRCTLTKRFYFFPGL
ncbi:caspase a-like isoform X2 [Pseudoliparis swirei]|uniref:caspase a-like isoform X2 n=1 Tax=Pseudoliparis swirei TaxID=2059687 RepID=UPI0024BD7F9C|nr:caspase a-like isoform X2 [Pseudoliparis swirei]